MYSNKVLLILNKIALELRRHDHLRFSLHEPEQVTQMLEQAHNSTNPRVRWLIYLLGLQSDLSNQSYFTQIQVTERKAS